MQSERWRKYGLSLSDYVVEHEPLYAGLVTEIHDAVCDYLDAHPEIRWGSPGSMYYDIADLAVGRLRVEHAAGEARRAHQRMADLQHRRESESYREFRAGTKWLN